MELMLPVAAMGALYVAVNSSRPSHHGKGNGKGKGKGNRDGFQGLPNVELPARNFPEVNEEDVARNTSNGYATANTATDKYFDQQWFEERQRQGDATATRLAPTFAVSGGGGEAMTHDNMTPFNGGRVRGHVYHLDSAEATMDHMTGAGSQHVRKVEQAPLFKPEEHVQWAHGTPNQSDFFQSRVNPSLRNHAVKPFESVQVAPGLNLGYGTAGSQAGFNAGMQSREVWQPKTVDEMRVATNPKLEYTLDGLEGAASSRVQAAPVANMIGQFEKQRPDTYYANGPDRWLTTTGAVKGETARSEQELGIVRRPDGSVDYVGPATSELRAATAPQYYEPSQRPEALPAEVNHGHAQGRGLHDDGRAQRSHANHATHRSTTRPADAVGGGFSTALGAVVAPLMDMLKATRKDETAHNVRVYGEGASSAVPKGPVYNPLDTAATTVRETTMYAPTFRVNNQSSTNAYLANATAPSATQRDSSSVEHFAAAGGQAATYGDRDYSAAYKQHNNEIKSQTIGNRTNQGRLALFNPSVTVHLRDDQDRFAGRANPVFVRGHAGVPSLATMGAVHASAEPAQAPDRWTPDLLAALKQNPYVHSIV